MIIRVSAKLAKKIAVEPSGVLPPDSNPYRDWSARLFTSERVQFILITNTTSLYSVIMPGKGITDAPSFIKGMMDGLGKFMQTEGLGTIYETELVPGAATVSFSKALNRSVTGSMNDLVFQAKLYLQGRNISSNGISSRLNEIPFSSLKYFHPREAFVALKGDK